jgi:hypothetical protein
VWERGSNVLEDGQSDADLELSPREGDSGEGTCLSKGTPMFQEEHNLARSLFAVRMTKTRTREIWWSVDNFLFSFPAVATAGYHFALQFLFAKVS